MMDPEALARLDIDHALEAAGWAVHRIRSERAQFQLAAGAG